MSLTSLLSVASGALLAQERAVGIIGHNIANAETPGYTRQRPRLSPAVPQDTPIGQLGRGVDLTGVDRLRSRFFDDSWRKEAGLGAKYLAVSQTLGQVSGIIGEPSDDGLAAALDGLIDGFHTLASNPTDATARAVVLAQVQALTDKFHAIDARLTDVATNIGTDLGQVVRDANGFVSELENLNGQLRRAGGNAPDLLDRRDQLLDQLSQQLDVRVIERDHGTVDVLIGGLQLVNSSGGGQQISVTGTGPYQLQLGNPPIPITPTGGRAAGLIDAYTALGTKGTPTARATGLRGQLDDLALGIVSAINQIHSDYDPTTKPLQPTLTPAPTPLRTIVPLFDQNGVTAGSIQLNAAVAADPTLLAAGWSTAAGDNSIALRLAELRNLAVPVPGATGATPTSPAVGAGANQILSEFYTGAVGALGIATRDAGTRGASQDVLVAHLESQRQDVSGVNIDEEMVRLIEHQQAYAAAARLVKVADEMLQELVNLGR